MQGDLEIRPLAACRHCGAPVAPPVGPSYVYGIGAIGFQRCAGCGARWRCLWPTGPPPRGIRVRAAAVVGAAVLALGAGVAAYANTRASDPPELASSTRAGSHAPGGSLPSTARRRYLATVAPANAARAELRQFLDSAPPITPRSELDRRVAAYAVVARRTDTRLLAARWPFSARGPMQRVVAADRACTSDLEAGVALLNQPAFGARFAADATALRTAVDQARRALGLAAAREPLDPRFPGM